MTIKGPGRWMIEIVGGLFRFERGANELGREYTRYFFETL
jgi:hypothetical protein